MKFLLLILALNSGMIALSAGLPIVTETNARRVAAQPGGNDNGMWLGPHCMVCDTSGNWTLTTPPAAEEFIYHVEP